MPETATRHHGKAAERTGIDERSDRSVEVGCVHAQSRRAKLPRPGFQRLVHSSVRHECRVSAVPGRVEGLPEARAMSETASPGRYQEINQREDREDPVAVAHPRSKRRRWVTATVVLVVLGAGAGAAWSAGVFRPHGLSSGNTGAPPPQTYPVTRQNISETTSENATLGYASSYTVTGQGGGTLTWLPSAGSVIRQGQVLYRTDNGIPTVLMYGGIPAWRTMSEGTTGEEVTQLNHGLVALGYANSSDISALGWDYYSWETRYAVQLMEEDLGVS